MADILITGCSGGGKSTLLDELERRGHTVVREPGRRLIAAGITPWGDLRGFLTAAADMARADLGWHAEATRPVFYDRGLIDALAGLERDEGPLVVEVLGAYRPYGGGVFLAPPWPEIYAQGDPADLLLRADKRAHRQFAIQLQHRIRPGQHRMVERVGRLDLPAARKT